MKTFRKILMAAGLFSFFLIFYSSCKKETSSSLPQGQQKVQIRLTDDPINFDAVKVDIQKVEVQVIPDSCRKRNDSDDDDHDGDDDHHPDHDAHCSVWKTLDIRPGVYDLLHLSNGVDTILASGFTVAGTITKIRLTLGDNNSVVVDGVSYPLTLWNNDHQVTIKIKGDDVDQITPNNLQLWLDFDAGRSIVRISNNHFVLKPFLKVWVPSKTASISGKVLPQNARAVVSAISNNDTLIAIPEHEDGRFKIRGLRGTTAKVFINATANGYQDTTINNVTLTAGRNTDIGTIQLHR